MLADTTGNTSLGNASSTIVISYNMGECNLYAKILFRFNYSSAGRPGGLVVLPSNTTNVCLSLSLIPTTMRFDFICKNAKKGDQLLRAPGSVCRCNLAQVDEGRKCWLRLTIKMKARAEVGRGEEGLLCDPGSELLLGGSVRVVRG